MTKESLTTAKPEPVNAELLAACRAWVAAVDDAHWMSRLTAETVRELTEWSRSAISRAETQGAGTDGGSRRCTESERELLDFLYSKHPELKHDPRTDFDGWYADWNEVVNAVAEDVRRDGYSQSPLELIWRMNNEREEHRATIAACRAAGFIDDQGVVRKILGTLPLTADGCVIGDGCKVYLDGEYVNAEPFRSSLSGESGWHAFACHTTYSTAEAAKRGTSTT